MQAFDLYAGGFGIFGDTSPQDIPTNKNNEAIAERCDRRDGHRYSFAS
jgi:hypothetical protein